MSTIISNCHLQIDRRPSKLPLFFVKQTRFMYLHTLDIASIFEHLPHHIHTLSQLGEHDAQQTH